MKKQPVIVIVGPTAVGKTKTGIELAKRLNGEVLSGDSVQVYQGMDIGSAKVTTEEMEEVPHHLLDLVTPDDEMSVARFQTVARATIDEIASRGSYRSSSVEQGFISVRFYMIISSPSRQKIQPYGLNSKRMQRHMERMRYMIS